MQRELLKVVNINLLCSMNTALASARFFAAALAMEGEGELCDETSKSRESELGGKLTEGTPRENTDTGFQI
jgi:hypothetical protein